MEKEHLKVSEVFPLINGEKVRLGILDWGVKMTTLEDGKCRGTGLGGQNDHPGGWYKCGGSK